MVRMTREELYKKIQPLAKALLVITVDLAAQCGHPNGVCGRPPTPPDALLHTVTEMEDLAKQIGVLVGLFFEEQESQE